MGDLEQKAHDLAVAVAIEQQRVINDCKLKAASNGNVDISIDVVKLVDAYSAAFDAIMAEFAARLG
jgi:hypothetical protein